MFLETTEIFSGTRCAFPGAKCSKENPVFRTTALPEVILTNCHYSSRKVSQTAKMSNKLAPKCQGEPWHQGRQQTPLVLGWVACLSHDKRTCSERLECPVRDSDVTLEAREGLLAGILLTPNQHRRLVVSYHRLHDALHDALYDAQPRRVNILASYVQSWFSFKATAEASFFQIATLETGMTAPSARVQ